MGGEVAKTVTAAAQNARSDTRLKVMIVRENDVRVLEGTSEL